MTLALEPDPKTGLVTPKRNAKAETENQWAPAPKDMVSVAFVSRLVYTVNTAYSGHNTPRLFYPMVY